MMPRLPFSKRKNSDLPMRKDKIINIDPDAAVMIAPVLKFLIDNSVIITDRLSAKLI
jgi:hypothetical protein